MGTELCFADSKPNSALPIEIHGATGHNDGIFFLKLTGKEVDAKKE